jgi:hypothetical protein
MNIKKGKFFYTNFLLAYEFKVEKKGLTYFDLLLLTIFFAVTLIQIPLKCFCFILPEFLLIQRKEYDFRTI